MQDISLAMMDIMLEIEETRLPDVVVLTPKRFEDHRGYFAETWNARRMAESGLDFEFVQDNHSLSVLANTVRGLHFQAPPHAQDKLVRCGRGALYDVAVDIRRDSPHFGQWFGVELSAENGKQLLVPKGFLHGFITRTPDTEIVYKCTDYFAPEYDCAVRFDDPEIGVDWGLDPASIIVSEKDENAQFMKDFISPFIYEKRTRGPRLETAKV